MESVARELVENLGGLSNIDKIEECITRIRISVHSLDKVNTKKIKLVEEVLQIFITDTVQIVFGPGKSRKLGKIMRSLDKEIIQDEIAEKEDAEISQEKIETLWKKKSIFKVFFEKILKK